MADIVFGFGTSHGPLLTTPPGEWDLRANVDRKNPALAYRDGTYDFETLARLRAGDDFAAQSTIDVKTARFDRCQVQLDALADRVAAVDPDIVVIVGDDQHEWFHAEIQPSFAIYHGDSVLNRALSAAEREETIGRGGGYSMEVYFPPEDRVYPCAQELAERMITHAIGDEFDVTACGEQPRHNGVTRKLGHAYGFIYRRILRERPVTIVPILINTFFPPNQPTPKRCYDLGRSLGNAIRDWDSGKRIAVCASGGISHFVVDEDFDHRMLAALKSGDAPAITGEPDIMFRSGTSETKNWIVAAGMMEGSGLKMKLHDYVPCYRSEAGTGSGMAFATWQ